MTYNSAIAPQAAGSTADENSSASAEQGWVNVRGKFLFAGDAKFYVKGVTYGAFKPNDEGEEYHDLAKIDRDFELMAARGVNTVRIPHTTPPRSLLDIAQRHGLKVMVGLSAEQYVGYLIDRDKETPDVEQIVRNKVGRVAGHPALLCYAIGNEISASVVRWLGPKCVERYLGSIFRIIKAADPAAVVTYVNYPTTEYLHLPFLDLLCFNVYLESKETLSRYLLRLQNIAGNRPLIMSEVGLDALRNGEEKQASVLDWQIRTAFAMGCAGAIVFSWTDEWYRGDDFVHDWAFGLTSAQRQPKLSLSAVERAFAETPFSSLRFPKISVVVCTYNGARTIRDCLDGLRRLEYPHYEVVVVNDGSTDATPRLVEGYDIQLITTANQGLSHARNVGMKAASGEIVAYIDDDAYPDIHWLHYLAHAFANSSHAAIGGPNIEPPDQSLVAECVANAPGGPVHVLITDEIAEHIPGCNLAVRKAALEAVDGFDPQFRAAGDDVDLCWRLQQQGWTLGFSPAAVVWHHRRNSVSGYLRQQRGYGKAEALLERKWPEKYNSAGHHTLQGRIYGKGFGHVFGICSRVYHGVWGSAPFQSLYQRGPGTWLSLPTMPEWYLIIGFLAVLSALGYSWPPLFYATPLLVTAISLTLLQAARGALRASFAVPAQRRSVILRRLLTALLHLLQPLSRLVGRVGCGLIFCRRRIPAGFVAPVRKSSAHWTPDWVAPERRVADVEHALRKERAVVLSGDEYSRWDLEVRGGMFGAARFLMSVEDQGGGSQYVRTAQWPRFRRAALVGLTIPALLVAASAVGGGWVACAIFFTWFVCVLAWTIHQCGAAMHLLARAAPQPADPH